MAEFDRLYILAEPRAEDSSNQVHSRSGCREFVALEQEVTENELM